MRVLQALLWAVLGGSSRWAGSGGGAGLLWGKGQGSSWWCVSRGMGDGTIPVEARMHELPAGVGIRKGKWQVDDICTVASRVCVSPPPPKLQIQARVLDVVADEGRDSAGRPFAVLAFAARAFVGLELFARRLCRSRHRLPLRVGSLCKPSRGDKVIRAG